MFLPCMHANSVWWILCPDTLQHFILQALPLGTSWGRYLYELPRLQAQGCNIRCGIHRAVQCCPCVLMFFASYCYQ